MKWTSAGGHWVQLPDGHWLLVTPGAFVALLAAACLFGFCWGAVACAVPARRRRPARSKRQDWRGRWS